MRFRLLGGGEGTDARPDAWVSDGMRDSIRKASKAFNVAVISERSIGQMKSLLQLDGCWYAGQHGFEIQGAAGTDVDYRVAEVCSIVPG